MRHSTRACADGRARRVRCTSSVDVRNVVGEAIACTNVANTRDLSAFRAGLAGNGRRVLDLSAKCS